MNEHDFIAPPEEVRIERREFLRLSTAAAAAAALASTACEVPAENSVPFHDMPENLVDGMGKARYFHTVLDGTPVLVRTREGRPILIAPRASETSGRGITMRQQAGLMDLYDPDRATSPVSIRRKPDTATPIAWNSVSAEIVQRLKQAGPKVVLLTGPVQSPAVASAIAALREKTGMRHVAWTPIAADAAATAWEQAFGFPGMARPNLVAADLILGLGADFLDDTSAGLDRDFATRRTPDDAEKRPMSRFIQLEGRLSLTGANADARVRVRDSHLASVACALAHELIVTRSLGPLAGNADVAQALAPYSVDAVAGTTGIPADTVKGLAGDLAKAAGHAIVLSGGPASTAASGVALETAALVLNITLGAFDAGLFDEAGAVVPAPGHADALATLADELRSGGVDLLLLAGANPVYDAPAGVNVVEALAKVPFIVSLNDRVDETGALADLVAPLSHPFECWGDASLPGGAVAIQQPVIQPLGNTRGLLDVLVDLAAAVGDPAALAAVASATKQLPVPPVGTAERLPSTSVAWHYLRAAWAARLGADPTTPAFDAAWNDVLRAGAWHGPAQQAAPRAFNPAAMAAFATAAKPAAPDTIELQLYPHLALHDGSRGNNAWLHEVPDPITRIAWGGALSIAPRRFDEMKLANGDLVEVDAGHAKIVAPAYRHAGMHTNQVALPLGLGRTLCGAIGANIGANAFPLRQRANGTVVASGLVVTLRPIGSNERLAIGQGSEVLDREARPLVPATTLTAFEANAKAGTDQIEGGESAWPEHEYPKARWAMAIDLSKCTGCAKCVVGCQAENNIPVVGRHGILDGRPMAWMRIDRYYDAPPKEGGWDAAVWDAPLEVVEEPHTLFEPMLCQHCENAPCESVCPFSATMHSEDGLNQQIYNRCVGTRYCANNCPFKVRRFNYWEMSKRQESTFFRWLVPRIAKNAELNTRVPMQLKNNPEVTVRSRGVMEKCSFCVQRIRLARAEAIRNGANPDQLPDDAVVPACMEACPSKAITFGNLHAKDSRVSAQASSPRAMRLLDSVGVKPAISYLTKVRNDKA
ncbi:MAG: 4Fe-4S dicluster domain-containing protein [Vicinamibacterales bacterium]